MKENRKRLISAILAAIITVSSAAVTAGAEDLPEDIASGFEAAAGAQSASGVSISAENFPDEAFRNYVSANFDDGDGILSDTEISAVTAINVNGKGIKSLKGIEYFTALTKLDCNDNFLTELDVTQNTALTKLDCYENQITSLDLSSCTRLAYLDCCQNKLTNLEIKQCTGLTYLECEENDITSLDLSGLSALAQLNCFNCLIESLDISGCVGLKNLNCGYNYIETLDLSNCTTLESIGCGDNELTDLDVRGCTGLKELYCYDNQLTALDLSNNFLLEILECNGNKLTSLDVSSCQKLEELDCYNNSITSLDVSSNTELAKLYCFSNQIKSIDISNNTKLKDFFALPVDYTLSSKSLDELKRFGFDPAKASKWTGADYNSDTNSIESITADKITFNYKVAEYWNETLTIIPAKTSDKPYIPSIPTPPTRPTTPVTPSVPEKTEEVKETVIPEKPSFSAAVENGKAVISWSKIDGAESYNIYQYANGKYVLLGSTKKTSFRIGGLKDNKTYKLLVTAVNKKGESEYSKADIITVDGSGKPVNPDVSAVLKNGKAVLSWEKVPGAESYNIYRYKNGKYTLLGTTEKTSFRIGGLKKDRTYKFVVSAVNETGESRYKKASTVSVTRS